MTYKTFVEQLNESTSKEPTSASLFGFVENSTLFKGSYAQLTTALGVTGQIKPTGATGAVAILTSPSSGLNYIAGIEAGDGITAQTSPQGGVLISSSITNAAIAGSELINGSTLRRLIGGTGVSLVQDTDTIEITATSTGGVALTNFEFIQEKTDFPGAVGGTITLLANKAYYITAHIDLTGDRLIGGQNTVIMGSSSETASLTSTGLGSAYLFTSNWTTPIRNITFKDVTNAIVINPSNASTDTNLALDWDAVNFSGCTVNVRCGDIANFIYDKGAVLGSGKFEFIGSVGTLAINNSLFVGDGTAYAMVDVQATATITRRVRITYSSFVAATSTNAINFNVSATVPNEAYILDTCNFSGGGTQLTGVTSSDNKALFNNNAGITNSSDVAQYYMNGNTTVTTITTIDTPVKIAGATTNSAVTSKFTHTDNRATYAGALMRAFKVTAALSVESGNNNQIGIYIAKNGVALPESEIYVTTSSIGRAEAATVQTITELQNSDYLEIWVENSTGTTDVTATDLNVVIQ